MRVTPASAIAPKVLVAWDGSPAAATALPVAGRVARQLSAELEGLHVWRDAQEAAESRGAREKEAKDLGLTLRFAIGDAASEIIRSTEEPGVRLVVLTTHGRKLERDHRLGRVAERVVARTTRPVLIVTPESVPERNGQDLKRLLVPLDGTPKTAFALRPVSELALALGATIDLLYVAGPDQGVPSEPGSMTAPRYVDQPHHEWPEWAKEVIHRLATSCAACPAEVPVRMFLAQGDIGQEISRFATENQTDAIVLVRRSRLQPGRAKVIRSVLSHTSCFIIVVGGEET